MDDTDLLRKLRAGDKAVFNELVTLYANRVINTCYRFLFDKEDTEDISQEVFLRYFNQ